jgi:hypothetical protein
MRYLFFFEVFSKQLKQKYSMQEMMIFEIDQAKVPLLNIFYKQRLWVDISFAVVVELPQSIEDINDVVPIDTNSGTCIHSIASSFFIKDFAKGHNQEF